MKTSPRRPNSVEEFKLETQYHQLRERLLAPEHADKHAQPLAHWALQSDRGLPLTFLSVELAALLERSFDELMSTAGVGQRKMASLMKLLARAAEASTSVPVSQPQESGSPESSDSE